MKNQPNAHPAILAPAGNRDSFLAALSAGADAVYCGLKNFSARMEAKNFTVPELTRLAELAHRRGSKVFVALNTVVKPEDLRAAGQIISQLQHQVRADALIIQDLAMTELARQAGFSGELHLSTLANVSFPAALKLIKKMLGVDRVVLPRELNIDEIKAMAAACPAGLALEVFIHGALCFCVSGRCYWSSYMGGRSGLRGRCVQPCRRVYRQAAVKERSFACQDLSLDVLVRVLSKVPQIRTWKIEGRKKGPHYVYYTVRAYRMLRDEGSDPRMKKAAIELLSQALGRSTTHYHFLPQRPQNPVNTERQTGSGLFVGKIRGSSKRTFIQPRQALFKGDLLRIGYEDARGHHLYRLKQAVPAKGRFYLPPKLASSAPAGTPVFLTDRREPALQDKIDHLEKQLGDIATLPRGSASFQPKLSRAVPPRRHQRVTFLTVYRRPTVPGRRKNVGLWLNSESLPTAVTQSVAATWWWLPPVIWPEEEKQLSSAITRLISRGAHIFVLNAPWQLALFVPDKRLTFWAGPFCNIANPLAIDQLKSLGFDGAIASPELGADSYQKLATQSCLPLGIVVSGSWPLGISRIAPTNFKASLPFSSPREEQAWFVRHGSMFWLFPNWGIDLNAHTASLEKMGFRLFVQLVEPLPKKVKIKKRPGLWNWKLGLQ